MTNRIINQPSFVSMAEVDSKVRGTDTKAVAKSFYDEMANIMRDYADREMPMTILGITVSGDDKYSVIGTTLLNQFLTDNGNAIENLISTVSFLQKLDESAGKMIGG